ncbi:MAG: (Fe-S)-binding protein [Candidatus Methanolliviera hydrocarbonicum]|uniref:(Fe-S)-binding protein n=1 Tax=Candidatus Methanolliviera hydrocarbonicum TaxID=2491085 RepID=A0A520KVX3_9EURY|nr:MAG: (Fe-S)-binding protein [Candidatus Methanolliviera hydrocarbonicum]
MLSDYLGEFSHCFHCHLCTVADWHKLDRWLPICPTFAYYGFESFSAAGRVEIARALVEGEIDDVTPRIAQIIFSCTGCGACFEQCNELTGFKANHTKIFEDLKENLVERGHALPKHIGFAKSIEENHNPYYEPHEARFEWLEEGLTKDEGVVYFAGCTSSYREQQIAKTTVRSLDAADIPFRVLGEDEWCCGSPLLRTGQRDKAKETAKHNVEAIKKTGAKTIITSCAGCYRMIKSDYPKLLGLRRLGFDVVHSSQFFASLIDEGKVKFDDKIDMTSTYHDPCHIGRHMGVYGEPVYDEPRKVLEEIGVKIVEMPRNRENAWCCGSGGGVKSAFPDFALWTAGERVKEAESVGVDTIVTSCPFCVRNLTDAVEEFGKPFKVYDLSEILSEALK